MPSPFSSKNLAAVINALPQHIAVLDALGNIILVNNAWREFCRENNGPESCGLGTSYLAECERPSLYGAEEAGQVAEGLRSVLGGQADGFSLEYPCHSHDVERWFLMQAAPLVSDEGLAGAVVSHIDITVRVLLERALREEEERFRSIAEYAGDWEWWITPAGEFEYVSPASEELTGYKAQEFLADPDLVNRILHPTDIERYSGAMTNAVSESPHHYDEFRIIHKNGRQVWIGHLCRPIYDSNGNWLGRRASNRDITRQKGLERELRQYETIIRSTPDLVSMVNKDYTYQIVNDSYLTTFQMCEQDIVGKHVADVLGRVPFENVIKPRIDRCFSGETVVYDSWFNLPATGNRHLEVTYYPYWSRQGEITAVVVSARDITDKTRIQEALAHSEQRLQEAQHIARMGDFERDLRSGEGFWSEYLFQLLDIDPREATPSFKAVIERVHPDEKKDVLQDMERALEKGGSTELAFRVQHRNGEVLHLSGSLLVDQDDEGRPIRYHGAVVDVTPLKLAEQRLVEIANTDFLTGVANRRHFIDTAAKEASRSLRYGHPLSLLVLDIDHFKAVNDTHGHEAGDMALKGIVNLSNNELRDSDMLGRMGGEEFAILLPESDVQAAAQVAERIRRVIQDTPIKACGVELRLTVSLGCAQINSGPDPVDNLLKRADNRLYQAKRTGRNKVVASG